eukprot:gene30594-35605_t
MGRIAKFLEMTEQQQEEHTLSSRAYAKDLHTRSVGSPSVGFYRSSAESAQSSSVPTQASGRQSPFGVTSVQVAGGGTASPTLGSTLHALLANVPNIHTTPKNSTEMPHLAHTPSKRIRKGKAPARGHPISSCMGSRQLV